MVESFLLQSNQSQNRSDGRVASVATPLIPPPFEWGQFKSRQGRNLCARQWQSISFTCRSTHERVREGREKRLVKKRKKVVS